MKILNKDEKYKIQTIDILHSCQPCKKQMWDRWANVREVRAKNVRPLSFLHCHTHYFGILAMSAIDRTKSIYHAH